MTLVEPLAKRTAFLRTALATAQRSEVRVLRGRGEDLAQKSERWNVALLGGDTVSGLDRAVLGLTAIGEVPNGAALAR